MLRATGWRDKGGWYDERHMLKGDATRILAWKRIHAHMVAANRTGVLIDHEHDIYQFGVYTGGGLRYWLESINASGASRFSGSIWGFDSFEGMPAESSSLKSQKHRADPAWNLGGLNAAEKMGIFEWSRLKKAIADNIGHTHGQTHLIKGFFNQSLARPPLPSMRPALIADLDADLYTSTAEALSFLLRAGLLRVGSYVYYDDINYRPWFSKFRRSMVEAKRAHLEASAAWGLEWLLLSSKEWHMHWRPVLVLVRCARCGTVKGDEAMVPQLRNAAREITRRPEPLWFQQIVVGHCGITSRQSSVGSCEDGDRGALGLPTAGLDSWEDAAQECRKLCERCRRCRYMTVSLYYADCSWYHECDLPAVKPDRDRDFGAWLSRPFRSEARRKVKGRDQVGS